LGASGAATEQRAKNSTAARADQRAFARPDAALIPVIVAVVVIPRIAVAVVVVAATAAVPDSVVEATIAI